MSSSKGNEVGFLPWPWASICKITFCFSCQTGPDNIKITTK